MHFFLQLGCSVEKLIVLFCLEKTLYCLDEVKWQAFVIQDVVILRMWTFFYK